jgi:hypothetical protein
VSLGFTALLAILRGSLMSKQAVHNGQTCTFAEQEHSYVVDGLFLTSATQFKSKFFPKFNTQQVAEVYAKRNNYPVDIVLERWKNLGDIGLAKGNAVHTYAECHFLNESYEIPDDYKQYQNSVDRALSMLQGYDFVDTEFIVFSTELGLAGQIDLLMKQDNIVYIFDWKTDKQILTKNGWGESALEPISHLDDCNFNQHSIQLNLYQRILETENYFPGCLFFKRLIHITEKKYQLFRVPTIDNEIDLMLEFEKCQKQKKY